MLQKSSIPSGAFVLDGFKDDDRFISSEAVPNYVFWQHRGHEEALMNNGTCVNNTGSEVELVSIYGGTFFQAFTQVQLISLFVFFEPPESVGSHVKNILFFSEFGRPTLPFTFPRGILIPNNAKILFSMSEPLSNIRLLGLLRVPKQIGNIIVAI